MRLNNDKEGISRLKSKERGQKSFRNSSFITGKIFHSEEDFVGKTKRNKYETLKKRLK